MANEKNLKLRTDFTSEEATRIGKLGGKASGEKKKQRKTFKEAYLSIADKPFKPIGTMADEITEQFGTITVDEAIILAMSVKASNGDVQAATYLRDTIGEKPTDKSEIDVNATVKIIDNIK